MEDGMCRAKRGSSTALLAVTRTLAPLLVTNSVLGNTSIAFSRASELLKLTNPSPVDRISAKSTKSTALPKSFKSFHPTSDGKFDSTTPYFILSFACFGKEMESLSASLSDLDLDLDLDLDRDRLRSRPRSRSPLAHSTLKVRLSNSYL